MSTRVSVMAGLVISLCLQSCSDGNSTAVSSSVCGNGIIEPGEDCDWSGDRNGFTCTSTCTAIARYCGDGVVSDGEACDDGNMEDGDGCSSLCTVCGDGIKQGTESCDDGNDVAGDGCTKCKLANEPFTYGLKAFPARPLAIDAQERLYGDTEGVVRFDLALQNVQRWNDFSQGAFLSWGGNYILVSPDGKIWVAESLGLGQVVSDGMDAFVARLDPGGSILWNGKLPKLAESDDIYPTQMAVNGNNLVFAGLYNGALGNASGDVRNYAHITVYDVGGTLKWSKQYQVGTAQTSSRAMATAGSSICLVESSQSMASWLSGADEYSYALACFDLAGTQLWSQALGSVSATSLRIDGSASTVVAYGQRSWWSYALATGAQAAVGTIDIPALEYGSSLVVGNLVIVLGSVGGNLWMSIHDTKGSRLWRQHHSPATKYQLWLDWQQTAPSTARRATSCWCTRPASILSAPDGAVETNSS